jgi:hypothetical protein
MTAIFYDLETSDTSTVGQILNYCFIAVDGNYDVVDELSGEIRFSVDQLPRVGALLANRINPIAFQKRVKQTEGEACQKIQKFIQKTIDGSRGKVPLIGYNSARFDLPFLRTVLIRNGINPYFYGKLCYRDLYHLVRKLAATHPQFPRLPKEPGGDFASFSMEVLTHAFGLLQGVQTHESRDDVLLTIDFARFLEDEFGIAISTFEAYEALAMHSNPRSGDVIHQIVPTHALNPEEGSEALPMTLLDASNRDALWINLKRFAEATSPEEESRAVYRTNINKHHFFLPESPLEASSELEKVAKRALTRFKDVNLSNFFNESLADIEHHIYRLSFADMDLLSAAIAEGDGSRLANLPSRDAKVLYLRYELRHYNPSKKRDERLEKVLKAYGQYRYGGKMSLSSQVASEDLSKEDNRRFAHPTITELYQEVDEVLQTECSQEDLEIAQAVRKYYDNSDLVRALGYEARKAA